MMLRLIGACTIVYLLFHWGIIATVTHLVIAALPNYMIAVLYAYAIIAGPILLAAVTGWVMFTWAEES
jgi:hypothetical protein